jgi:hypothetical protein
LPGLYYDPEYGGDTFLRNVGLLSSGYTRYIPEDSIIHVTCCSNVNISINKRAIENLKIIRVPVFDSQQRQEILLFSMASRIVPSGAHPAFSGMGTGVKRQGREADHSPPSTSEVKYGGAISRLSYVLIS